jgi:cyanate lyase
VIRKIIIHNTIGPAIFTDRFTKGIFSNVALCGHKIKNIKERYNDIIISAKNLIISKSRYPGKIIKKKTIISTNKKDMKTNQRNCFGSKIDVSKLLGLVFFILSSIIVR